ncbi:unnamed protein product, partial [marine sediment metagenome]
DTINASMSFEGRSVDFVYVDASHDYDSVKNDIYTWFTKLKQGGWMAGHDYQYDVATAVDMIFKNRVERILQNTWLVR